MLESFPTRRIPHSEKIDSSKLGSFYNFLFRRSFRPNLGFELHFDHISRISLIRNRGLFERDNESRFSDSDEIDVLARSRTKKTLFIRRDFLHFHPKFRQNPDGKASRLIFLQAS